MNIPDIQVITGKLPGTKDFFEEGDLVEIIKGRLKGYRGTVVGTTETEVEIKVRGDQSYFIEEFTFEYLSIVMKASEIGTLQPVYR